MDREDGLRILHAGQVVFCVMSQSQSNEPGRRLAASIGLAIPQDRKLHGYLSEHHEYGQMAKDAGVVGLDVV